MTLDSSKFVGGPPIPVMPTVSVKKTKKKVKKEGFWIILSANHEAAFGANYKFKRFKTEEEAKTIARIMTIRHKVRFDVMKQVCGYKPMPGTEAVKV